MPTLSFAVIGAGIAGLTTAYLLRKSGHSVLVLEKYPRNVNSKLGGLNVPPNMARLLKEMPGSEELLAKKASMCAGFHYLQSKPESSELIGKMEFKDEIVEDLGCRYYLIPHQALHEYLLKLCTNSGVTVRYEFDVAEILAQKGERPMAVSRAGDQIVADIVVGADGKNSVARTFLLNEDQNSDTDSVDLESSSNSAPISLTKELIGTTSTVPISVINADRELAPLLDDYCRVWMGNESYISGVQCGPDIYKVELLLSSPPDPGDKDMEWTSAGVPSQTIIQRISEYDPRVLQLFQHASAFHWSIQTVHDLPQYVSQRGHVVLVGDAAHSVCISTSHNVASAFEDAFTLGRLFAYYARSSVDISLMLNGYQQIRAKRTTEIERTTMDSIWVLGLPPSPARDGRNNGFRLTLNLEGANDETMAQVWASYVSQFNYDPRDATDEWWLNWGKANSIIEDEMTSEMGLGAHD